MDDNLRADLHAKLSDAMERRIRIEQELQEHGDRIQQVRERLGNPYFFHPRPADHPESRAKYTGYASHDPALRLIFDFKDVEQEIRDLLNRLNAPAT
jgi:hypothetical protein